MIDAVLREHVTRRANNSCEYCLLKQEHLPYAMFQIEHIIPRKHGGGDDPTNLALTCDRCNSHKGANLTGIDPKSGAIIALYNPRRHSWQEHFRLLNTTILGLTAVGRTTVRVLNMNEERRVRLRAVLKQYGQL